MRIYHKLNHDYQAEAQEESPNYYISDGRTLYPKTEWSKVWGWKDVTNEVIIVNAAKDKYLDLPGIIAHKGVILARLLCGEEYRIRHNNENIVVEKKS